MTDTTIQGKYSSYHVIKSLKSGGMGEVLLARDDKERRVAIKRPFLSAQEDGLARFELEAKASALDHPNIAKIYEGGFSPDGRPFLAMEFVDGEELKEMIDSGKPMDLLLKLSIIEQVCAGLGYAHQKGFIHRDIKPGNIMVTANGVAKIIDFGIAKMVDLERTTDLTQTSQVIGSLHYIAPERFKNEAMDGRVDVFSTGVMLYLLLTGRLPFSGGEMTAAYQIVNEAPTPLRAHLRDYPEALDSIMDQALAKNPDQRFPTAEDFADALHEVIEDIKETRILKLFDDAERLTVETRYEPALDLLDEALKLDPSNTQVRKLRKIVREHQDKRKRTEKLREYFVRADELLAVENYAEALAQLKEALRVDPASPELKARIASVEETKQRYDRCIASINEAEAAKSRGDITGALRISEAAVREDPDNTRLLALRAAIAKQLEREAQEAQLATLFDAARSGLAAKNFDQVAQILAEAEAVDRSHPVLDELRHELARARERESRRQLLEEIHRHVNEFLRADNYEQATDLLSRAIDKLPDETMLHRLKLEVDTAAQKFDSIRFVDRAVASAQEAFASDPEKAIDILRQALQHRPGDERLMAAERSLRQQADAAREKQLLDESLREAREFLKGEQFDKAIGVLEAYQLEHGSHAEVDHLLILSRQELANQRRRALVERTATEARSLMSQERLEDAARALESALQSPEIRDSGDATLSGLLEDVRTQQQAVVRKRDAILKRAVSHRERGELDDAIKLLSDYLATGAHNPDAEDLLHSIEAERTRRQVTKQAIATSEASSQQANFPAALESLQAVVLAYGESDELTKAAEAVKRARVAHAQKVVTQSIETSRAALLAGDVNGAMTALRSANEMVEFADANRQADWRRIGQAAKKAQSAPTGTIIVDPLADLPDAPAARKPVSPLILGLGGLAACAVIGGVGVLVLRKPPPAAPVAPTESRISIAKAPAGALVSIDGGTPRAADANGSLSVPVSPGTHLLQVTKDGYDPYNDKLEVKAGDAVVDNIAMAKQPPASNSGTLVMESNLPGFKVMVDDHSRGEVLKKQGTLTLEAGSHTIQYLNEDGSDTTPKHTILIAAGKSLTDAFTLKQPVKVAPPPAPTPVASAPGSLIVQTSPGALVTVDGQAKGHADQSGSLTINSLSASNHTVDISLDNFEPISGRTVTITSGQPASFRQPLSPMAPATGILSIQTTPGAQVSFNNGQSSGTADGSGIVNLANLKPGPYSIDISKDGFQPAHMTGRINVGSQSVLANLMAKAAPVQPATVVQPAAPAAEDHSADYKGIQAAVSNFVAAFQSRNMGQFQAAWLNAGSQGKNFKGVFESASMVKMSDKCQGQPNINGDTATQRCDETTQYDKSDSPRTNPFNYTFVKQNGKWVLKDRTSLR
ncbi:Serine/threonine protein kinase [Bryocella elongata]|uniref:non-specific serine/threonine protein kinase n=1 Tax=Bryocella elongata TaxID=863522 RepID=A0A1H6ACP2_9BACT|nr:protein kinase [Bryocella elongata]SEG46529.1 Serine/threonine protein kinase [Bryocella elongata]